MERDYIKLNKEAKSCMRLSALVIWAIILVPLAIFALLGDVEAFIQIGVIALAVIAAIYIIIAPGIRYERYRYFIGDEEVMVRRGFLWIHEEIVPIERLHKLEVRQGPIARIYKLSTVCVTTAGGDISIKFLREDEAERIASTLKAKINEIVREERN